MNKNLADISFWEYLNKDISLIKPDARHPMKKWINENIDKGVGSCIEIGCFPGRYLTIFGDLGYQLNGIDQLDQTEKELPKWLKSAGYNVGEFIESDFLTYDFKEKTYDVVYSLGFIEHFTNWDEIIRAHTKLVKKHGIILIETPNFKGFIQQFLHYFFDRENLNRHNISAMNPNKWEKILKEEGFTIQYKGYFYGFDFWVEDQQRNKVQKYLIKYLLKIIYKIKPHINYNSRHYSPFCGIIAQKL